MFNKILWVSLLIASIAGIIVGIYGFIWGTRPSFAPTGNILSIVFGLAWLALAIVTRHEAFTK
jgi:hypothetical protein